MTSPHLTASADLAATRSPSRVFYRGMAVVLLVAIAVGFSTSARSRAAAGMPPLEWPVLVHAGMFFSWFLIFLVQTMLAATGRITLHRALGYMAAVVAAVMVVDGPLVAISAVRKGHLGPHPADLEFMLVMIGDVLVFGVFVALAVVHRRRSDLHRTFMLLGSLSMLPPAIARWPGVNLDQAKVAVIMIPLVAAVPIHDLIVRRRLHPAGLWGAVGLLASVPVRVALAHTAAWHQFAGWLTR
jgi:hypothetical protein